MDTEKPYLGHPSAILECLRLEEQQDRPILETDGGKDWLQNQNTLQRAMCDDYSLTTDTPLSDCISLQRDRRITSLALGPLNPQMTSSTKS